VNTEQLKIMIQHIATKPELIPALHYHFIDGLSVYASERKAGLGDGTLGQKVRRFNKELEYIERFNKAAHINEDQMDLGV
jgi:hypothetical protein